METLLFQAEKTKQVFIARQPIFDKYLKVYAYELFFRCGDEDFYSFLDGDKASSEVIANSLLVIGMKALTEGKKAFINFTQRLLLDEVAELVPHDLIAVEILETVEPDDAIVEACNRLKSQGYMLVLDDFKLHHPASPLMPLADVIKIDIQDTCEDEIEEIRQNIDPKHTKLLAEKVETHEEFNKALEAGYYDYFQGYFFSKPTTLTGHDVPVYKIQYIKILREVHKPQPNFDTIERYIKGDVAFSYKLLRRINSAFYGLRTKVESIKHALILLGIKETRSLISLVALQGLGQDKPSELVELSIIRARFAELIANKVDMSERAADLFIMGLFSLVDAIFDRPLDAVLEELPIHEDIKEALLESTGPLGKIYELVLANERGEWDRFPALAADLEIDEMDIPSLFIDSLAWTQEIMQI